MLSWQVEKSSPKFLKVFRIGDFKCQIEFQIKFHKKIHKHTSAGLAAPTILFEVLSIQSQEESITLLLGSGG